MDYEKCFEDELDDISDFEDEEEELFQQEKDDFLAASIAQLKRDLHLHDTAAALTASTTDSTAGGVSVSSVGGGSGEEDGWGDLMASIQKTSLQLEAASFTLDSNVVMTPRAGLDPDEVSSSDDPDSNTEGERNRHSNSEAPSSSGCSHSRTGTHPPLLGTVQEHEQEQEQERQEVSEEVRDMLFEMVVSVEYIHSLSLSLTQEPCSTDYSFLLPVTEVPPLVLQEEEDEEAMTSELLGEGGAEEDDMFVHKDLVDSDTSHKRKFEVRRPRKSSSGSYVMIEVDGGICELIAEGCLIFPYSCHLLCFVLFC